MPDFDADNVAPSSALTTPTCQKDPGGADDCSRLLRILQPLDNLPKHVCDEIAAATVVEFIENPQANVYFGSTPFSVNPRPLGQHGDIYRPLGDGNYAHGFVEWTAHRDRAGQDYARWDITRTHPFPFVHVSGKRALLHCVIRQHSAAQTVPPDGQRRQDLLNSPQWRAAVNELLVDYNATQGEWIGWPRDAVPYLATLTLQAHALPGDFADHLIAEVEGADLPEDVEPWSFALVTTYLLYDAKHPEWSDIVQTTGLSAICADDKLRAAARKIETKHVQFIKRAFPGVRRISGRHRATGFGSRPRAVKTMIDAFLKAPTKAAYLHLKRQVTDWGDKHDLLRGVGLWRSVAASLRRDHGIKYRDLT